MPLIKICGLTRSQDIEYANQLMPDFIGFVFAKSKRKLSLDQAILLKAQLDESIGAVGVFVDEQPENVVKTAYLCALKAVQFHGSESEEYIANLRPLLPADCMIWKGVRVHSEADVREADHSQADMLLFDAFSHVAQGGTGERFDWGFIKKEGCVRPFILAGGISPENAKEAVTLAQPYGIDASSSVETNGLKDFGKMKRLIDVVRGI